MKKKTTSNPLKTFNDNKAKAYMKAGGAMKAFKKSLLKAEEGMITTTFDDTCWPGKPGCNYGKAQKINRRRSNRASRINKRRGF